MRADPAAATHWSLRGARALVAVAGFVAIVASGGGAACFDYCGPGPEPLPPFASIDPHKITVQVGTSVVFTTRVINATAPTTYRWCRRPAGSATCTDIAGATGASFTLAAANLADDGSLFTVTVSAANGSNTASSQLGVSALPGIVFGDTEFADAAWSTSAMATPSTNGPTHTEQQAATGGDPGAFRLMGITLPQAPSAIRVFHSALQATYDPAAQGAIRGIDFSADCIRSSASTSNDVPYIAPMLEQGGRKFAATSLAWYCASATWEVTPVRHSIGADEFVLVDGPDCAAGAACPDFSAVAAPIRFGYASGSDLSANDVTGSVTQGIDNWSITVWRR